MADIPVWVKPSLWAASNARPQTIEGMITVARYSAMAFFAAATALAVSSPAAAQALDDRFWIELSGYYPRANTTLAVSRPGAPGTVIDFEEDLDLDESQALPAVYGGMRIGNRWLLAGEFYALDREGSRSISRDLVFDGATFPVGVDVSSSMKSDVYRVTLGYSFVKTDRAEFGGAIGLHATDFDISMKGEVQVGPGVRQLQTRRRDFIAPMPTLGVYGTYEATPKVILTGRADYLSLGSGDYDGSILNTQAAVAYRFNETFQAGVSYRYVAYELDVEKPDYMANVDYDFSGPAVFIRMGFR